MRKSNCITIIALVVTIVVTLILATIVLEYGTTEIDNAKISTIEDLKNIPKAKNVANKYKDDFTFIEVDKVGVLENCGVDNYCIGYGIGNDQFISEIAAGDFITCMYNKKTDKAYLIYTYMNFSQININYEIRNRLYNYLLFFTLFCFCD